MAEEIIERTIEIEAQSLEEAREQLKSQIPEGFHLLSEQVISAGDAKTVTAFAATTKAALEKAQSKVPDNAATIEKQRELVPEQTTISVEAFDEQSATSEAEWKAKEQGLAGTVRSVKLIVQGKRGILGIGAKPNQYEVEILGQPVVEVTYKTKAKISVKIVDLESLIATLKHSNRFIRQRSAKILDEISWQPNKNEIGVDYWIAKCEWKRCIEIGASAVGPLISVLAEPLAHLEDKPDKSDVQSMFTTLRSDDHNLRKEAVNALMWVYRDPSESRSWTILKGVPLSQVVHRHPDFDAAYIWAAYPTMNSDDHTHAKIEILLEGLVKCKVKSGILARLSCYYTWKGEDLKALDYAVAAILAARNPPRLGQTGSIIQVLIFLQSAFQKVGLDHEAAIVKNFSWDVQLGSKHDADVVKTTGSLKNRHKKEVIWAASVLRDKLVTWGQNIRLAERKICVNVAEVLKVITGQDFGIDADRWQRWWQEQKDMD